MDGGGNPDSDTNTSALVITTPDENISSTTTAPVASSTALISVTLPISADVDLPPINEHPLAIEWLRSQSYPGSEIVIEQTLEPGVNYSRYIASYRSEGNKIFALLTIPQGEKPTSGWPVVIFNHGYIPPAVYRTTERYVAYVDGFARNGYMVFRSDYRGHGFSDGEATGGYGTADYTVDILNAVAAIKQHPDANSNRIGMWGHSMGGHITLRSMVLTQDIKAGVIWAGVVGSYPDLLERWRRPGIRVPVNIPAQWRRWREELVNGYGAPAENPEFWAAISSNSYVAELSGPIQLHHGTADDSVPFEFSNTLDAQIRAAGGGVENYIYPGDDHNLSINFGTAMARSIAFFDSTLEITFDMKLTPTKRSSRWILWCTVTLFALAAASCGSPSTGQPASANVVSALSSELDSAYAYAYEPIEFVFPADHGAHPEYKTEWWYYTGNLTDEAGQEFGYQLTFFRSALAPHMPERESALATNQIYMAHFAVTDVNAQSHVSFERYSRGAGELAGARGEPAFTVWLEDWSAQEIEPGVVQLQAASENEMGSVEIDLLLEESRPILYHGNVGLSQKGPEAGNASYYYSMVGLETTGQVIRDGTTSQVHGLSWMDHEFGTSALSDNAVGWDWFSLQLDNGVVVMLAMVRTADGGSVGEFEGTVAYPEGAYPNGEVVVIKADDFSLTPIGEWTSPSTDIVYPAAWEITLPAQQLTLTVEPLIPNQEMQVSFVYWEGAVQADGTMAGEPVTGRGYVELTGYGPQAERRYR